MSNVRMMNYGVANTFYFNLWDVDGLTEYTGALASGDVTMSIDGAALGSMTTPVYANGQYSTSLTAANLECKKIKVKAVDLTATAVFMDAAFDIVTFGNASSEIPIPLGTDISSDTVLATAVWANSEKTLTAGTKDTEIDAIKVVTDNLPDSGVLSSLAQESTVAKEATKFAPATDVVANVTLVDTVTTNTDMVGTDNAITDISTLALEATVAKEASLTEMKGSTFSEATDSLEAIRDQGDSAWVTGAGGSSPTVEEIRTEMDDNSTKLTSILEDTGTSIPAQIEAIEASGDIVSVNGVSVTDIDDFKADVSGVATPAQVNAEVLDVLSVDTFAEPGKEAPDSTASLVTKIGYLFKSLINKKDSDGSTESLYNSDGVTVDQEQTVSDDEATSTKGAMSIGS